MHLESKVIPLLTRYISVYVFATFYVAVAAQEPNSPEPRPAPRLAAISIPLGDIPEGTLPVSLSVSPDRKRIAFFRKNPTSSSWTAIIDGIASVPYESMGKLSPIWSPDSKHVAYVSGRNAKKIVVVDGQESKLYDAMAAFTFSPDSKHYAYLAEPGDDQLIVVDGIEQTLRFDALGKQGPVFSPDSQRVGYIAKKNKRWVAVVDEREGQDYDGAGDLVFSDDSKHFGYFAQRGTKVLIVMDGVESEEFDSILRDTKLVFTSPSVLEALAIRGREILGVTLTSLGPLPAVRAK